MAANPYPTIPIDIPTRHGPLSVLFSEAVTPSSRIQCSKLSNTAFGKSISKSEFLEREALLGAHPLAAGARWRFWNFTLADASADVEDEKEAKIGALIKTLHRDLLIRDGDGTRREQGYCICSVVTDKEYRGCGLASALLKKVAEWMDGEGGAAASMLYSDVGDFYVSKGWDILDASQSTLTVPVSLPSSEKAAKLPKTRLLTADEIPALAERDVHDLENEFRNHDPAADETLLTVVPTPDMISWLQTRANFMNTKLAGKIPEAKGSICESAGSWVYWFHDLHAHKMTIQRIKLPQGQSDENATKALAALLLSAVEEAARWKTTKVIIWSPGPEVRNATKYLAEEFGIGVEDEKRGDSIPCLRWRGDEKRRTTVYPNEYYAWS
ncbi:uncharacterized protein GGS22DRAFT_1745 [Annulohypoxylon maeteangense]|uniref:uncharacterized protein n=1 Tax=Annulohypoxylon maeteangense TaxID=1927788 RepID=UPI002007A3C7|nr:uncharacterized protein GGS22DRAFT_1745 [Annulohypoxylon maeteangense]KAI0889604.1 hypothetical protein GGS22DRAFT_1745 [Annulohypoxylon maeteangense]